MRPRFLYAAAVLVLAALCGCTKTGSVAGAGGRVNGWTQPHVLRFADAQDVNTLNPYFGQITDVGYLSQMTMAWLIKWDEHNRPYPELATQVPTQENGGVSKDGLAITYHLRKGVRWSDGAPFNADDVVFSTRVLLNPATNVIGRQGWDQITTIDEPDKMPVVYHLRKPYSPLRRDVLFECGRQPVRLAEASSREVREHQQRSVQRAPRGDRAVQVSTMGPRSGRYNGGQFSLLARTSKAAKSNLQDNSRQKYSLVPTASA